VTDIVYYVTRLSYFIYIVGVAGLSVKIIEVVVERSYKLTNGQIGFSKWLAPAK
jgi:hypothetical protein